MELVNSFEKLTIKKKYGQFFTTNYEYILNGLEINENVKTIIEPFCGSGELLKHIKNFENFEKYDIISLDNSIVKRDTLLNPPDYTNKFILTNPPYLARNKNPDKSLYDKYNTNDLYKCFIKQIIQNPCTGGIIIIPLNFWCSVRISDIKLRKEFLEIYNIDKLKIFENQVFEDTSYSVCAFKFVFSNLKKESIDTIICNKEILTINLKLNKENNYSIGGEMWNLKQSKYKINRLIEGQKSSTNMVIKCIDDKRLINIEVVADDKIIYDKTPNKSCRTYATLTTSHPLTINQQKIIADKFNSYLLEKRKEYNSLFLTNYREKNRKRISFDLVYKIVSNLCLEI